MDSRQDKIRHIAVDSRQDRIRRGGFSPGQNPSFVAIQLAWMLRPFIGAPSIPISFLRAEQWGSCYLKLWEAISRFLLER